MDAGSMGRPSEAVYPTGLAMKAILGVWGRFAVAS